MLEAQHVSLSYGATPALRDVSLRIEPGVNVALMGASGSGKSSLLHCLAGVLVPDDGSIVVDGVDLSGLGDRDRSRLRLEHFGVVFQFGDLVPELTLVENVMLPLQLLGVANGSRARSGHGSARRHGDRRVRRLACRRRLRWPGPAGGGGSSDGA